MTKALNWQRHKYARRASQPTLDRKAELADIRHMANAKKKSPTRPVAKAAAKPARKAAAKSAARKSQYIGRTEDGLLIPRPDFLPESFTLRQLDEAVRKVKRQLAARAD